MSSDFPTPACLKAVQLIGRIVTDGHMVGRARIVDGPDWIVIPQENDPYLPGQTGARILHVGLMTMPRGPQVEIHSADGHVWTTDLDLVRRGVTLTKAYGIPRYL